MSILDRWLRLKYPEQFSDEALASVKRAYDEMLRKTGVSDEAEGRGVSVGQVIDERAQATFERMIGDYDTGLLDALDITPADFTDMLRREGERHRGGTTRSAHITESLDKALHAFLEVDKAGGSFTDAVDRAEKMTEADRRPPSRVTVRNWLKEIAGGPWTTIPKSTRGRPKKKNS